MARRSARQRELDEIHEELARERTRLLRQMMQRLAAILTNDQGIVRLRAITDEEWEEAELAVGST